jgi:hypothetical protein
MKIPQLGRIASCNGPRIWNQHGVTGDRHIPVWRRRKGKVGLKTEGNLPRRSCPGSPVADTVPTAGRLMEEELPRVGVPFPIARIASARSGVQLRSDSGHMPHYSVDVG